MNLLTESRFRQLRDFEEKSFRYYCDTYGYVESEHADRLLAVGREKFEAIISDVNLDELAPQLRDNVRRMQEATDFLALKEVDNSISMQLYVELISNHFDHIPIDFPYIAELSRRLGLEPTPDKHETLLRLIDSTPLVSSWDREFNAFVTGETDFDGLPGICIFELLKTACEAFLNVVTPIVFDFGETASLSEERKVAKEAASVDTISSLKSVFGLLLGEHGEEIETFGIDDPVRNRTLALLDVGSVGMIWLHECGHLIQGHLRVPQCHAIEFEADRFAFILYARETVGRPHGIWYYLGAITSLFLIDIIETICGVEESDTHPAGHRRIAAALSILNENAPEYTSTASQYISMLEVATAVALREEWGVSRHSLSGTR